MFDLPATVRRASRALRSYFQAPRLNVRRLEGAGGGPRLDGIQLAGPTGLDIAAGRRRVAARARGLVLNEPIAARIAEVWATSLVGTGITLASQAPQQYRAAIQAEWAPFCDDADVEGRLGLTGLLNAGTRTTITEGEAFFVQHVTDDARLQIQAIPPDLVDDSFNMTGLPGGGFAASGVVCDSFGRPVAYRLFSERPTDPLAQLAFSPVEIPADQVIHMFKPISPGVVRGLSWLAPVILALGDMGILHDSVIKQQQIAALLSVFFVDVNATTGTLPFDGKTKGGIFESGLTPGAAHVIPGGMDAKILTPAQAQPVTGILKHAIRLISAGVGIPYWLIDSDLSDINYSSMRGSLIAFRDLVSSFQQQIIIRQALRPLFRKVVTLGVLSGRLDLPGFDQNPEPYFAATWHPPALPWVDPLKDSQATALNLAAGLISRRQAVSELGRDIDQLDEEIAADRAREQSLGLSFSPATAVTDRPATENPQD